MSKSMKGSKRTYGSKTSRPKRVSNTRIIARQEARKVIKTVGETKMYDVSASAVPIDYTNGAVYSLTDQITRGTDESQYLGDSINPVGLKIRMQLERADAFQLFRVVLIQNISGGIPLLSTLLQSTTSITAPLSFYNKDYQDTYRVLYDRVVSMDEIRCNTTILTISVASKRLRKLTFNSGSGAIERGGIYLCVISDSAIQSHPLMYFRSRLYFKDP